MSDDALGIPEHRDTVEQLERGLARVAPPDDLYDRISAETRPAEVVTLPRRRLPAWASSAAAAALAAAAAVAITLAVTSDGEGLGDPLREVHISNERVDGTLAVYGRDEDKRVLVVDLDRVAAPPPEHLYTLWMSRPGSDVKIPIGSFSPSGEDIHLEVPLPAEGKRVSIDISIEEEDGPPDHSGQTIATARLT